MNATRPVFDSRFAVLLAGFLCVWAAEAFGANYVSLSVGAQKISIAGGTVAAPAETTFALPLLGVPQITGMTEGRITATNGNTLTVAGAGWTPGAFALGANQPYGFQITSGAAIGFSAVVNSNTEDSLTLLNIDFAALGIVAGPAGDTLRIFPIPTLNSFFGSGTLIGAANSVDADLVSNNAGTDITFYFNTSLGYWVRTTGPTTNRNNITLPTDGALSITRKGPPLTFWITGRVRDVRWVKSVPNASWSYTHTGFPTDVTLGGLSLQTTLPGWVSAPAYENADFVAINYVDGSDVFYFHNGSYWQRSTGPATNSNSVNIPAGSSILIFKRGAINGFTTFNRDVPYALNSPGCTLFSTASADNPMVTVDQAAGTYTLTWNGQAGYTYFIQQSTDLRGRWHYLPVIKSGTGGTLQHTGTLPASSTYWRLQFTDTATANPATADFDGDGVNNTAELAADTDPLDRNNGRPAWWSDRGVLTASAANDYAAVNMGQVKWIATKARDELDAKLPDTGSAPRAALNAVINSWDINQSPPAGVVRNDYAAVNIGQLKNLAKLFYDRLAAANYHGVPLLSGQTYPWTTTTSDDNDYAAANIGQVKFLFSFDIPFVYDPTDLTDTDNDGLPDGWELFYFGNLAQGASDDFDNDGVSNLLEYQLGRNPTKPAVTNDPTGAVDLRVYRPL